MDDQRSSVNILVVKVLDSDESVKLTTYEISKLYKIL